MNNNLLTPELIFEIVSKYYEINLEQILSKNKKYTFPRQIAIFLSIELTEIDMQELGKKIGRDHITIYHSWQAIKECIKVSEVSKTIFILKKYIYDILNILPEKENIDMKYKLQNKWPQIINILIDEYDLSRIAVNCFIRPLDIISVHCQTITLYAQKGQREINFIKHLFYDMYLTMAIEQITGEHFEIILTDSLIPQNGSN